MQHRQNTTGEPAVVVNQTDAPNSYCIIQENGALQPKVYRCTISSLKIRSTSTDGNQKAQIKVWMPEKENTQVLVPAVPYGNRNSTAKNSQDRSSSSGLAPPLPTSDLPNTHNFSEMREEDGQLAAPQYTSCTTLENALDVPDVPVQCKSTRKNFGQEPHRFRDQLYV